MAENELPDDPEKLKVIIRSIQGSQAGQDKKVAALLEENKALQEKLGKMTAPGEVAARLDKIEAAYNSKVHRMEIDYHVRTRAVELSLDRDVLEGLTFASTEEAESYLTRLSDFKKRVAEGEKQAGLLAMEKPRSGAAPGAPRYDAAISRELAGVHRG